MWQKNLGNYVCAFFSASPQSFLFLDQPQMQRTVGPGCLGLGRKTPNKTKHKKLYKNLRETNIFYG
jgi:hypothetical protein